MGIRSVGGLRGSKQSPTYNTRKAHQINFFKGLRQKATNLKMPIFVTDIHPGLVDTAMAKGEGLFWVMPLNKTTKQIFRTITRKRIDSYAKKRKLIIAFISRHLHKFIYDKM